MSYEPATLPPAGHPNTETQNPADFGTDEIEKYTLGAPPVWDFGHPIANSVANIMHALGKQRG